MKPKQKKTTKIRKKKERIVVKKEFINKNILIALMAIYLLVTGTEFYLFVKNTEVPIITAAATSEVRLTVLDGIAPIIYVYSPQNNTVYNDTQVLINFTAIDTVNVSRLWYFNGSQNVSYTTPHYMLFDFGNHTLIFYANDSSNNIRTKTITFNVSALAIPAPENISITFNNTANSVKINWSSVNQAQGYYIWYGENLSYVETITEITAPNITLVGPNNTTWIDQAITAKRFYKIASYSSSTNMSQTILGKITLELNSGFNGISMPLNLTYKQLTNKTKDPLPTMPADSIKTIYRYNINSYEKSDYIGDFGWYKGFALEPGRGYYVNSIGKANLTFVGNVPASFNITLSEGYNLVGWYNAKEIMLNNAILTDTNCSTSIYKFSNSTYQKSDYLQGYGWHGQQLNTLEPGYAYQIYTKEQCDWVYP